MNSDLSFLQGFLLGSMLTAFAISWLLFRRVPPAQRPAAPRRGGAGCLNP